MYNDELVDEGVINDIVWTVLFLLFAFPFSAQPQGVHGTLLPPAELDP
jgi:hypothetical protein